MNEVSVDDYRRVARRRLPHAIYEFVEGGAQGEASLRRNSEGFDDLALVGRVLRQNDKCSLVTTVLGREISLPVMIAPTGGSGVLWPDGELATARAAASRDTIMIASACSVLSLEDIASASQGPKWLQTFPFSDRGLSREFLDRGEAAGYEALVVTLDAPVQARRPRDLRNKFSLDQRLTLANIADIAMHWRWWVRMIGQPRPGVKNFEHRVSGGMADLAKYIASFQDLSVGWDELRWLRENTSRPIVVKGIAHPDDARIATECGAQAIVVSNHGGRQFDGGLGTIDILPSIVDAVGDTAEVYLDGGITRGGDVMKAIALGARACLVGRSHLWGLASAGQKGVEAILDIFAAEMRNLMQLGGWSSPSDLGRDSLARREGYRFNHKPSK